MPLPKIQHGRNIPRQFRMHTTSCRTPAAAQALAARLRHRGYRVFGMPHHIFRQRTTNGTLHVYEYYRVLYMTPDTTRQYTRWLASPASSPASRASS